MFAAGRYVLGLPVAGDGAWLRQRRDVRVALGVGDNRARAAIFESLRSTGITVVVVVHPRATVSSFARMGAGAVVLAHAVLNAECTVGEGAIVNTSAVVEHDVIVGAFAHVSPGATLGGAARLGPFAQLGTGACVLPGVAVGESSIVGAGGVVVRDLAAHVVAVGVPARITRQLR